MAKIFKLSLVLFVITAVTGLILGAVYTVTLEPIRFTKEKEKMEALAATLPGATEFKQVELSDKSPHHIKEINEGSKDGELIGYNITVESKGYAGPIEMIVGISKEGELMDSKILNHSETPGLGAKAALPPFNEQFRKKQVERLVVTKNPPASADEISAISGATITSNAVVYGINAALLCWRINFSGEDLKQEDVDAMSLASPQ